MNMPADNIKRTIEKATGGGEGEQYEEIVYEGYGPGGVAILVEAATDNRNRTAAEVRSIFSKAGGQLAGSGAVAWQFEPRGPDHGRRRATPTRSPWPRSTPGPATSTRPSSRSRSSPSRPTSRPSARRSRRAGVEVEQAESAMIAKQTVELDEAKARQALRLVELLEDLDDVQRVTANFDIPEEVFAEVAG